MEVSIYKVTNLLSYQRLTNKADKFKKDDEHNLPLAFKLLSKRTTLVGTIYGNKRELPKICKTKKNIMIRFSSLFYRSNGIILTIYKNKPKKQIFKYKSVGIEKSNKGLHEMVESYNETKFGVDITDQMAKNIESNQDQEDIILNVWILYKETTTEKISRKNFMFQLVDELATENVIENIKPEMES
ncbi:piggyBac transposable element-derived protein 4-like [Vespula maculifrons]|uniref:PiggyBac transposable element-derived protein 4-like n=1 Tax=Vespula maculifrons TaxID=7453 RepID=A0ABD2CKH9_VESMC